MSKKNPLVAINLGGKERHLKLDLNAMAEYEEATGKSLFNGVDTGKMGAKELRALLWACLLHEDESLTLKDVGGWIDGDNMTEISERLTAAFKSAMPDHEEGGETADPLPQPPTG